MAPTVLEAAGLPQPKSVNGVVQTPIEGTSMLYTFDNAKAAERHTTQYFEMLENTFMNIKNRSSKITAEVEIPAGGASGAILSQGGRFGGWALYVKDSKPAYTYNFLGLARYTVAGPDALPTGAATVTLDFAYDGGGVGKGGKATLYVNGKPVAEGRVEKTQPNIFSADETADVGVDNQTPVAEGIGIGPETRFTGTINKVTLEVRK